MENSDNNVKIRKEFYEFCKSNGVKKAPAQYECGIRAMEKELGINIDYEYQLDHKCEALFKRIEETINSLKKKEIGNRKNWIYYTRKYIDYKNSLDADDVKTDSEGDVRYASYEFTEAEFRGINKVVYGTPGCGKSYYVENYILTKEGIGSDFVFRTTFHLDYTNTDFIGQILPRVDGEQIKYEMNPGPFTLALSCAINNPKFKVALIIEELNRGNAPAIFGDIFQLLDRKENGESRYEITNVTIQEYLKKESNYTHDTIKIPKNLYIYATMNTSDQNVFTLDTAFKRRWSFQKLTNKFNDSDKIKTKLVPGFNDNVTWSFFVETINNFIINHNSSLDAEDKLLGKYFIDDSCLLSVDVVYSKEQLEERKMDFAYKVFAYLWSDVAKFNRHDWFKTEIKTLDVLIENYMKGKIFFVDDLSNAIPLKGSSYNEVQSS